MVTKFAAKFEAMPAMDPDGGLCVVVVVVNEGSIVDSQLGNVLAVGPKGVLEQREWKGLGEADVGASVSNDVRCM